MRICIPSRSRTSTIGTMIARIPPFHRKNTRIFVPPEQFDAYRRALHSPPFDMRDHVAPCPPELTIGGVRDFMGRHSAEDGQDHFLMIDDDVRFEVRRSPEVTNSRQCTIDDTRECLNTIEEYLQDGRWGMVGIAARQLQNQNGLGDRHLIRECTRNTNVTGWRVEDFLRVSYLRVLLRSDFDATLQLLRQGRKNVNLCWWQHSQRNHAPGGCSDYRNAEVYSEQAQRLADLHPGLVSVVERNYPGQSQREKLNAGRRLEVVIQWKRAFGYDQRHAAKVPESVS